MAAFDAAQLALRTPLLAAQPPEEQARLLDLTNLTVEHLAEWLERYPIVRRVRAWPVALSIVAAAPWCSVPELVAVTQLGLWIFALDDVFDEQLLPEPELLRCAADYQALALGQPPARAGDALFGALDDVQRTLQAFPLFSMLRDEWASAMCRCIQAMVQEYRWRQAYRAGDLAAQPSYEVYLDNGAASIGIPPHDWATIIVTGDASAADHRAYLREMDHLAAVCVRLANDLRSSAKEVAEGNINSLVILEQALERRGLEASAARLEAHQQVHAELAARLEALWRLRAGARTRSQRPEASIAAIAQFCSEFYAQFDYHTLATGRQGQ